MRHKFEFGAEHKNSWFEIHGWQNLNNSTNQDHKFNSHTSHSLELSANGLETGLSSKRQKKKNGNCIVINAIPHTS